ncbi:hypothetical protein R6242_19400 [Iodobacter sp. CM08]|uniref:hypothetical protein n=1 Tax=Iodobacter sp. CM08 TaxID=3085902 RepID=UPI002981C02F|nr:hypothetical protein [Iodobacter sp. CM08]MDW5418738.1 hypothetical protein [Iodobacter sp. CM08]
MWKTDETTRHQGTHSNYLKRYLGWQKTLAKMHNTAIENVPVIVVVEYVIKLSLSRRTSTWRQYRAAIIAFIEENNRNELRAIELLEEESTRRRFAKEGTQKDKLMMLRTSSKKSKGLTKNSLTILEYRIKQLSENHKVHNKWVIDIIKATIISGIRPIEWIDADLCDNELEKNQTLVIKNAKASNGRANGEYRTIILNGASKEDIETIELAIGAVTAIKESISKDGAVYSHDEIRNITSTRLRKKVGSWISRYVIKWLNKECNWKALAPDLNITSSRMAKKRITDELDNSTLYTFRHQMFANAKAAFSDGKISREEIAAIGGHSSTRTHQLHYGTGIKGDSSGLKIKPTVDSVSAVSNTNKQRSPTPDFIKQETDPLQVSNP